VAVVGIGCVESRQAIALALVQKVARFASPSQSTERKSETRSTKTGIMRSTRMKGAAFLQARRSVFSVQIGLRLSDIIVSDQVEGS
jgi:hypothetical protein